MAVRIGRRALLVLAGVLAAGAASAADWPTYGGDVARSHIAREPLPADMKPAWTYRAAFEPAPAWDDPRAEPVEGLLELRRVHFDDAFQVAVVGGRVYFGSSGDNKVNCLDAASGRLVWSFITGGPVRLAPTVDAGRVYVGSDDGVVYCLDAEGGNVLWRFRAAPDERRLLGHGRLISRWPVRTGVMVEGGVAYVGAGIFPSEGVFLYALDAATGKVRWKNDGCSEPPQSRISPQGYLLATPETLIVPMGRVPPAAFSRADGRLLATPTFGKTIGGAFALVAGKQVITGTETLMSYSPTGTAARMEIGGRRVVVDDDRAYIATGTEVVAADRGRYPAASRVLGEVKARKDRMTQGLAAARTERGVLVREAARLKTALEEVAEAKDAGQAAETARLEQELAAVERKLENWKAQYARQQEAEAALDAELKSAGDAVGKTYLWRVASTCDQAMVLAGDALIVGGPDGVEVYGRSDGKPWWSQKTEGTTKGLAVAGGRVFASTDSGRIHCYAVGGNASGATAPAGGDHPKPAAALQTDPKVSSAAADILKAAGVRRGYCIVYGVRHGELAIELARQSELRVYALATDDARLESVRRRVDAAGLYGGRVTVDRAALDNVPYSDYVANLIVSEDVLSGAPLPGPAAEAWRLLKPCGGVLVLAKGDRPRPTALESLGEKQLGEVSLDNRDGWWTAVRGPLAGAADWTHLYCNPGNTAASDDQRVKGPLGLLWFGSPGPARMVNRHERAAGPLSLDGRLFCQGQNCLMAYDAYNGLKLWERQVVGAYRPNASHDAGNLAIDRGGLYVAVGAKCLRLDPDSGETKATFTAPRLESGGRWGWIALDRLLYGSVAAASKPESQLIFALDPADGSIKWRYPVKSAPHNTLAMADGRLYFVDRTVTAGDRAAAAADRKRLDKAARTGGEPVSMGRGSSDVRRIVALDAATGKVVWERPLDLAACGASNLAAMVHDGVLIIYGVYLDGHFWQQFFAGEFATRRVTALDAADGRVLWSKPVGYRVRPLIVGDTLHAEPWAFDLRTGRQRQRTNPVTGATEPWQFARPGHHCGCPSASPHSLFFRSYCLGYYDLLGDSGTMHFGGQRTGCWINFIPAAGLLLVPEASVGCLCPFPNMCTVVLQPVEKPRGFSYYSVAGPLTPVKQLGVHFGVGGDRKDSRGDLWLGFPRPKGSLVAPLAIETAFLTGGGYESASSLFAQVENTADPWLYAAAVRGLARCTIPLVDAGDGAATYRVRLHFCDPVNDAPGKRVFDVKLQGKTVLRRFDVVAEAGGRNRAVIREFEGVDVADKLVVEFVPPKRKLADAEQPILQGISVRRQTVASLGCLLPNVLLNTAQPRQEVEVRLANFLEEPFDGAVDFVAAKGVEVTPARADVRLEVGGRTSLALVVAATSDEAGPRPVAVRFIRRDGTVALERTMAVEHLGRRGRAVLKAVEDAGVSARYVETNKGSAGVMLVDGGDARIGDTDHAIALLKFKLDVPGRPIRALLRIANAGNPTKDSGVIRLVEGDWDEASVCYGDRPRLGAVVGRIGAVEEHQIVERPLELDLSGRTVVSLAIEPTTTDGTDYLAREGGKPAELIVEYED